MQRRMFTRLFTGLMLAGAQCALQAAPDNAMTFAAQLTIGSRSYSVELVDNASTRELVRRMPLEFELDDLYGRELCHHLSEPLPANEVTYRGYDVGEIIYWPPRRSFVVMYLQNGEQFSMQSLGRITGSVVDLPKGTNRAVLKLVSQ